MEKLTPEERSIITRYLSRPRRNRLDYFFSYAIFPVFRRKWDQIDD
jgi:hypothetical protein